jgi:hypothetical protein
MGLARSHTSASWRVAERLYASGTVLATRAARRKAVSGARRVAEPGSARRSEPTAAPVAWAATVAFSAADRGGEWARLDSNQGPTDYESAALTS